MRWRCGILMVSLMAAGCGDTGNTPPALRTADKPASSSRAAYATTRPMTVPPKQVEAEKETASIVRNGREEEPRPEQSPTIPANAKALNKQKTLFFEVGKDGVKRVLLLASVVQRQAPLEFFLINNPGKDHEAILNCDADAREIHLALMAAGAEPGHPVSYTPYKAATGTRIRVTLNYFFEGRPMTVEARHLIRDVKTKKELAHEWVFAGSRLDRDPIEGREMIYHANGGMVISLSNFPESMMDLPIESTDRDGDLQFEAWTERIPPRGTKMLVTLEPVK